MDMFDFLFSGQGQHAVRAELEQHKAAQRRLLRRQWARERGRKEQLEELENELGELALFCRTAVILMIEKGIITPREFMERMKVVDASDGTEDGKFTGPHR